MKRGAALVPALWAGYNACWIALLAGFGGSADPLWLWSGAAAIVELFGAAILLSWWRKGPSTGRRVIFARGEVSVIAALGVTMLVLATALGLWLIPPGAVTLCWAMVLVARDLRRWRRPLLRR